MTLIDHEHQRVLLTLSSPVTQFGAVVTLAWFTGPASDIAIILQAMANLLVRDLPDDVHAALQQKARRQGQSLQQYLTQELMRIAQRPSLGEVLDRIERRAGGAVGLDRAASDLAEERSRR
ncbi:MAG: hypothetical protein WB698_03990 [Solirubrobacteraceae bacterium]